MTQRATSSLILPAETASAAEVLEWGIRSFGGRLGISTSFQKGSMALLDMAVRLGLGQFQVFTIDTGRLPEQTYELIARTRAHYGVDIEVLYPDADEVSSMVSRHGPDLFYEAVSKRRLCCEVRKVRPLKRKLAELDAWVVGLRRSQGEMREKIKKVEIDSENGGILKLAPLADWSEDQLSEYIRKNDVPEHPLYAEGYASIGCAPCTRAAVDGEPARAGRWWWEKEKHKECGIHQTPNGAVKRELDVLLNEMLEPARS